MVIQQFRLFPERFTKFGQPKYKLLFDTKECKKDKKRKKNCDCSENQIEVRINLSENYTQSCIIGDGLTFRKDVEIDIISLRETLERIVKEGEANDKNNI